MLSSSRGLLRRLACRSSSVNPRHHSYQQQPFLDRNSNIKFPFTSRSYREEVRTFLTSAINYKTERPKVISVKRRSVMIEPTELDPKYRSEWPKITLFGDSITRRSFDPNLGCWGSLIANAVGNYFDVDFRGFDGYNSKWALELAPKLFPKHYLERVEIFVLFFGHNDSFDASLPIHIPVHDYESNMRKIVDYLLANGLTKSKIILLTPTWYDSEGVKRSLDFSMFPPLHKDFNEQQKYSDAIQCLSRDYGIDLVDFFNISSKSDKFEELFCDGIHLSREGAKLLFNAIMPLIETKIETTFKKPLADLCHTIPADQHPEVKPKLEAYRAQVTEKLK